MSYSYHFGSNKGVSKVSVSDVDKQFLILAILRKWRKHALQILVMCWSRDKCWLKMTPMFFAEGGLNPFTEYIYMLFQNELMSPVVQLQAK